MRSCSLQPPVRPSTPGEQNLCRVGFVMLGGVQGGQLAAMQPAGSKFPDQELNLGPWRWEHWVLSHWTLGFLPGCTTGDLHQSLPPWACSCLTVRWGCWGKVCLHPSPAPSAVPALWGQHPDSESDIRGQRLGQLQNLYTVQLEAKFLISGSLSSGTSFQTTVLAWCG